MRVPTTLTAVIVAMCSTPSPRVTKHTTDVADAHDVVPQSLSPSLDVGVVSRLAPKFTPDTVTLHPVVMPALKLSTKLTVGAGVGKCNCYGERIAGMLRLLFTDLLARETSGAARQRLQQ